MSSSRPRQVDFPAKQVTFQSYLPDGQGPRQVICQLNKKSKLRLAQDKQNLRAACPKGELEFKLVSSPAQVIIFDGLQFWIGKNGCTYSQTSGCDHLS